MIACFDVDYKDETAQVACLVFRNWNDEAPHSIYKAQLEVESEYIPGQFYKRELPCLLHILKEVKEELTTLVVDSYVYLDDEGRKGLGAYLYEALGKSLPIIGVAKNSFQRESIGTELIRGKSSKPLYITSAGIEPIEAAAHIKSMHGKHRLPTLLKQVDRICREW